MVVVVMMMVVVPVPVRVRGPVCTGLSSRGSITIVLGGTSTVTTRAFPAQAPLVRAPSCVLG